MDYDSTPVTATFIAGTTRAMVNILLTMDGIVEAPETFDLIFTIPSSLRGQVIPGTATKAAAIITDDDSKKSFVRFTNFIIIIMLLATTVKFNQSVYHVIEDSGSANTTLVLSNRLSSDITVEVYTTNITASGEHYIVQLAIQCY